MVKLHCSNLYDNNATFFSGVYGFFTVNLLTISKVVSHLHTKYGQCIGTRSVTFSYAMINNLLYGIQVVILRVSEINEPRHEKTCLWGLATRLDSYRSAQIQTLISLSLESLGIATIDIILYAANNKGADQTALMRRLICAFVVRIWHKQVFS